MAAKYIFHGCGACGEPKRQPVGTVRRSPGAFGLIPGGSRVLRAKCQVSSLQYTDAGSDVEQNTVLPHGFT